MNENIDFPSLLGGSVFQVVDYELFPDDKDPNQVRLLLTLHRHNGPENHLGSESSYLSLLFPDRGIASELFHRLADQMAKDG